MKILIMTDMEGVAGVLNRDDWVEKGGRFYQDGKRLLTAEVNAAVTGFFDGGATEVIVWDAHGAGGLIPEQLDKRAQLMPASKVGAAPWGLDRTFAGLAFVGQHAKAGTPYSHITHTLTYEFLDSRVNDLSIGEYGRTALCARELGIPTILACGEKALTEEAKQLTPGVVTVAVKEGLDPDGLDNLDGPSYARAKLNAKHLPPEQVHLLIRDGAREAARKLKENPAAFRYPDLKPPYTAIYRFRRTATRPAYETKAVHTNSFIALMNLPYK
jgi:D-amino peptidase